MRGFPLTTTPAGTAISTPTDIRTRVTTGPTVLTAPTPTIGVIDTAQVLAAM